jgi:Protein of unknown function (DUF2752)
VTRAAGRAVGWTALAVYLAWNAYWLVQGRLAPALFLRLTGWPAPTTGLTRALLALAAGDWRASLAFNPLAVPIVLLLAATFGRLAWLAWRRRPIRLSWRWLAAWLGLLAVAWVAKLNTDPSTW